MQRVLVERAIGGDREAFADLVTSCAARQYAIALAILRDGDQAQDAVQEALVAAWRGSAPSVIPRPGCLAASAHGAGLLPSGPQGEAATARRVACAVLPLSRLGR